MKHQSACGPLSPEGKTQHNTTIPQESTDQVTRKHEATRKLVRSSNQLRAYALSTAHFIRLDVRPESRA
jgi:hypothetical protein